MSKSNRKEEIFHLGASAARRAYQLGLEDFSSLIIKLEEMKKLGVIRKYYFKAHQLWVTTSNNFITGGSWGTDLDEVHALLDSIAPQNELLNEKNLWNIEHGDLIACDNGEAHYFIRRSLLRRDYAVLRGVNKIRARRVHKDLLIGATRIPQYQLRRGKNV